MDGPAAHRPCRPPCPPPRPTPFRRRGTGPCHLPPSTLRAPIPSLGLRPGVRGATRARTLATPRTWRNNPWRGSSTTTNSASSWSMPNWSSAASFASSTVFAVVSTHSMLLHVSFHCDDRLPATARLARAPCGSAKWPVHAGSATRPPPPVRWRSSRSARRSTRRRGVASPSGRTWLRLGAGLGYLDFVPGLAPRQVERAGPLLRLTRHPGRIGPSPGLARTSPTSKRRLFTSGCFRSLPDPGKASWDGLN